HDAAFVDGSGVLVGHQHHDDVGAIRRFGHSPDVEARGFGTLPCSSAPPEANNDVCSAFAEIQGVGVSLAAVSNDGKGAAFKAAAVGIGIVVHPHWCGHGNVPD